MLGENGEAERFVADLRETREQAAAMMAAGATSTTPAQVPPAAAASSKQGSKKVGGGGYMTGSAADKRMSKGGASNLRDLSSQKAREAEEAAARLERNMLAASGSRGGSTSDIAALVPEEGMTAYLKADELDEFGIAGMKKEARKKKGGGGKGGAASGADSPLDCSGGGDENAAPVYQKPKVSRAERAHMLQLNSDVAFLVPGRHPCKWVGNGSQYKLVGNCLDCGKILSDQEGEGPCLVCGSEQVYLASTNAMLDGTPIDQAIMAKRRRGGGQEGEQDEVDLQLLDRNAEEDLAFLRAMDLRDSLLDFEKNRAARTTVIDDQSDYFDSSAHWLTDDQKKLAAAQEKAFLERVDRRRGGVPVTFSIDVAGRRIYGAEDETPLYPEGDAAAAAAAAAPGGGSSGGDGGSGGSADVGAAGATSVYGDGAAAKRVPPRKSHGPTVDLMGPTGQNDMNLGARHGVLKEQNIGKAALEGRANEIYDLLMANILSGTGGGGAGGSGGAGRSRVQHDTDRSAMVCAVDAPDEDADGVAGCFADSGADCAASSAASGTTGGGANEGVGGFVEDHAGDAGMCLSMHQPWATLLVCSR